MRSNAILNLAAAGMLAVTMMATPGSIQAQGGAATGGANTILKPADMQK